MKHLLSLLLLFVSLSSQAQSDSAFCILNSAFCIPNSAFYQSHPWRGKKVAYFGDSITDPNNKAASRKYSWPYQCCRL